MKKCLHCKKQHKNKKFCSHLCANNHNRCTDLLNRRYGTWTVLSKSRVDKETWWICKCDCGIIKEQKQSILIGGYSTKCRKCKDVWWQNSEIIGLTIYNKFRDGALKRKKEWSVSHDYLTKLLVSQNFKCAISGIDIGLAKTCYKHNHSFSTASLDRIDSNKGYVEGNVQWVHKIVNKIKQNLTDESLIEWCYRIVHNVENTKMVT